ADVAQAEHGRPIGDDCHGVPLDRQVPGGVAVRGDRLAHACDTGRVGHREVVTGLERDPRYDLELPTEVQEERPVGDVLDLDPVDGCPRVEDLPQQAIAPFGTGSG